MNDIDEIERLSRKQQSGNEARAGDLRRMGSSGPVYEVVRQLDAKTIEIRVIGSHEIVEYPTECFMADPGD